MNKEILLEKYIATPITVCIDDDGMLECNGVIVNNEVIDFDAVTDTSGAIHGIYYTYNNTLQYFRMQNGLPSSKTVAAGIDADSLAHFSISEGNGILHILICRIEKNMSLYHYRTQNNSWNKSPLLSISANSYFIDSCPHADGSYSALIKTDGEYNVYTLKKGKWHEQNDILPHKEYLQISMSRVNNATEFVLCSDNEEIECMTIADVQDIKDSANKKEAKMANGNIINSKFISQMEQNSADINSIKEALNVLKEQIEALKSNTGNTNQNKFMTMCRESVLQHDNQINQLSIRIQELSNRINALVKRK